MCMYPSLLMFTNRSSAQLKSISYSSHTGSLPDRMCFGTALTDS